MLFLPILGTQRFQGSFEQTISLTLSDSIYLKDIENSFLLVVRCRSLLIGLHGREEQHLLDAVGVGEQHGQSVDADAPPASGR